MKRLGGVLVALLFALGSVNVFADGTKIGVVDLQKMRKNLNHVVISW